MCRWSTTATTWLRLEARDQLAAKAETTKPSLIRVRTVIGYGSSEGRNAEGTRRSAGQRRPLKATKKNLGWPEDKMLLCPRGSREAKWGKCKDQRQEGACAEWEAKFAEYKKAYPELGAEYRRVTEHP